jgi:hypothetical protein
MRMSEAEEVERLRREVADLRRQLEAREGEVAVLGLIVRNGGVLPVLPNRRPEIGNMAGTA